MSRLDVLRRVVACGAAALALSLVGCGDDGDQGPPGPPGPPGDSLVDIAEETPETLSAEITRVTIASPPVVRFSVEDGRGRGVIGLQAGRGGNVRFTLAKLIPGENGDADIWQSYVNRASTSDDDLTTVTQATYDREGTLVDHGDGSYTYTFLEDVTQATDPVTGDPIPFEPSLTHRLVMQISGGLPAVNLPYDFVPNGGAIETTRDIAMTSSCNECHGSLRIHGSRYEVKYCVTCHNPGTTDPENGETADMAVMTHRIHAASMLSSPYELGGHDYSEVTYPQQLQNCRKCHNGDDEATPDGDNWRTRPTAMACGSCHDNISFVAPPPEGKVLHSGGARPDNSLCASCHPVEEIERYHLTENATPNNPELPFGVADITYEISKVTVNETDQPVVDFNILRDGEPMDLLNLPADLTGPGRYPGFLLSYALPQDGIDEPADYNNIGESAGQPISVSLEDLLSGAEGSVVAGEGVFTATFNQAFPEGATLRSVTLQGYFRQLVAGEEVARHTYSVVGAVEGDEVRREIADTEKCLACHEIIEGHGGNRVSNVQVCVTCHNTNLSSSGRTVENPNATIIGQLGDNPLTYPEATNNLKDMIHGIHASAARTTDYEFVRNRNNGIYYNWSEVTFPNEVSDCAVCHKPGTWAVPVPEEALVSTDRTTTGNPAEDRTAILAARASVPNETDLVITPNAAACFKCHDSGAAIAHMEQNGAAIQRTRASVAEMPFAETCSICHGEGRSADVSVAHGQE